MMALRGVPRSEGGLGWQNGIAVPNESSHVSFGGPEKFRRARARASRRVPAVPFQSAALL